MVQTRGREKPIYKFWIFLVDHFKTNYPTYSDGSSQGVPEALRHPREWSNMRSDIATCRLDHRCIPSKNEDIQSRPWCANILTVYPKKYAHGFVVLCFVVVMQSFIMNSHEVFIHIHQGCFAGTGAISQCITTPKHSQAKTVCIFLGIHCNSLRPRDAYMCQ